MLPTLMCEYDMLCYSAIALQANMKKILLFLFFFSNVEKKVSALTTFLLCRTLTELIPRYIRAPSKSDATSVEQLGMKHFKSKTYLFEIPVLS